MDAAMRGMNLGFMARNGYFSTEHARKQVDAISALGVQWIALVPVIMQESYHSTRMFRDFEFTPGDDEVVSIIEYIHSRGMSVMLKLHIECFDSVWRGRISFPSNEEQIQGVVTDYWGPWFRSLTACMRHYARICTGLGVKAMCIGCEMSGADQKKPDLWRASVAALRERYSGIVTYQANDAGTLPRRWGDVLDLVGMSYYVPAAQKPGASLDEMIAALRPSVATLSQASEEMGKPIFFGECGCRSLVGGAIAPWDYHPAGPCDGQEQSNYLEAVWTLFHKEPWWRGLFWWTWDEHQVRPQNCTRAGDAGFTIAGKPAEAVLKRLYNRISP